MTDNKKPQLEAIKKELLQEFNTVDDCPSEKDIQNYLIGKILKNEDLKNKSFCIDVTKAKLDIEDNYHKESEHLATDFLTKQIFHTENFIFPLNKFGFVYDIHIYFPYFNIEEDIMKLDNGK